MLNINKINKVFIILICFVGLINLSSCISDSDSTPDSPDTDNTGSNDFIDNPFDKKTCRNSILVYAVASNNLSTSLDSDVKEMLQGGKNMNLSETDVFIYSVQQSENPSLRRMMKSKNGNVSFETIEEYERDTYSTDPKRISEIIKDYEKLSDAETRGLVLWSHATGFQPSNSDHIVPQANYWFGQDIYQGKSDYCDIMELQAALPDDFFDYIWFDCCYMSSIECLYQLRSKADYFVGCAMELASIGSNYELLLPSLSGQGDLRDCLIKATTLVSEDLIDNGYSTTFAVVDSDYLNDIAFLSKEAMTGTRPSPLKLLCYSRKPVNLLYDFGQFLNLTGKSLEEIWDENLFREVMNKLVVYKNCSAKTWSNKEINKEDFSGISIYYFEDLKNNETEYYKKLDWFKNVYTVIPEF